MKNLIVGPCSAESLDQLEAIILNLIKEKVHFDYIRAGVWKPRTQPNSFEGYGEEALKWISEIKKKYNLKFCIEVATEEHVNLAMKYNIDALWIGARTTTNPFLVQTLAETIAKYNNDILVMIKNPINPDIKLWKGALDRFRNQGIQNLKAIHRGFNTEYQGKYRNEPLWDLVKEFKSLEPQIDIIVDPSHIAGKSSLVEDISLKTAAYGLDGLMIETHSTPKQALSDAHQQITEKTLADIIKSIENYENSFIQELQNERDEIDRLDNLLLEVIEKRFSHVEKIAKIKKKYNKTIVDSQRFVSLKNRLKILSSSKNIEENLIDEILDSIHKSSLKKQQSIIK